MWAADFMGSHTTEGLQGIILMSVVLVREPSIGTPTERLTEQPRSIRNCLGPAGGRY